MKYITTQTITRADGKLVATPYFFAKNIWGGRMVPLKSIDAGLVPKHLGVAFTRYDMKAKMMYPKPFHLLFRFLNWLDYWTTLPVGKDTFSW